MNALRPIRACLLLVLSVALTGCAGSSSSTSSTSTTPTPSAPVTPTPVANTGAAKRIYVIQQPQQTGNGTVLQFAASSSGSVSPAYTLAPGAKLSQVATDQVGNIYFFNGNIVEYSTETTGTPSLVKQITAGTASRICCVDGMAVSPAGAVVLGQDNGEVDEWGASATGAVAPTRFILGASEIGGGMSPVVVANHVAVDSADNLYVVVGAPAGPALAVFGATAAGNTAPARTLGSNSAIGGLAVDAAGNLYVTTSACTYTGSSSACTGTISVYGAGSGSSSAPTRVITGSATQLHYLGGIQVDALGTLYVLSISAVSGANPTVLTFAATAAGNVAPTSSFTSTAWTSPDFNPSLAIY